MKKFYFIVLPIICFSLILAACSTPPTEEMERAFNAVTRAENDANAVTYAANILVNARDSLDKMQGEADAKRYEAAKNHATEAINYAERAIAEGSSGALRARNEAASFLEGLQGLIEETASAINAAMQVPGILLDFDSIQRDMESARQAYAEARQSFEAGNYRDAITKGQIVRSLLSGISTSLNEAAQETSRKQ